MRKFTILLTLVMLIGCAGMKISNDSTTQTMAYFSGKGMGVAINTIVPDVDADLTKAWESLMARNQGVEEIPADQMIIFYNDCVGIIALHTADPYGLIQDLGVLLTIYGAQFNESGDLIGMQPVPMVVMNMFGMGYSNGRMVALR